MKQQNLNDRDRELKAKMRALISESKVPLTKLTKLDLASAAAKFPSSCESLDDIPTTPQKSSDVYHWPKTADRELVGIALCQAILTRTSARRLLSFRDQNNAEAFSGSKALFDHLGASDYWQFTASLKMDERMRKNLAIEYGLSAYYLWPKPKTQFVYATRSRMITDECPREGCLGVVGTFIVNAPLEGQPCVEHGQAYYAFPNGELLERGEWRSSTFAINGAEFVILYELTYKTEQHYEGLICVRRVQDEVAVSALEVSGDMIGGTRAFRGYFHAFRKAAVEGVAEFYCEELSRMLQRENEIRALLTGSMSELLEQLRWEAKAA